MPGSVEQRGGTDLLASWDGFFIKLPPLRPSKLDDLTNKQEQTQNQTK